MGDGLRTIHVATSDETLLASLRSAAADLDGWNVASFASQEECLQNLPARGDVLILDSWLRGRNVYEFCRVLTGRTHCRMFIVVEHGNRLAEPIAKFAGATGVLERPLTRSALTAALRGGESRTALPEEGRDRARAFEAPESLLRDLKTGEIDRGLVRALIDSETGLFNYAFLNFKLDEEFKRAKRFDQPLACVMLGFEGQASSDVLRELAGIFLETSRDTDLLGRFDEQSFLFLLPSTGPDGASIMAARVAALAEERGLCDLVGDPLVLSVGISTYPHPELREREDLYAAARRAYLEARKAGGGVVGVG